MSGNENYAAGEFLWDTGSRRTFRVKSIVHIDTCAELGGLCEIRGEGLRKLEAPRALRCDHFSDRTDGDCSIESLGEFRNRSGNDKTDSTGSWEESGRNSRLCENQCSAGGKMRAHDSELSGSPAATASTKSAECPEGLLFLTESSCGSSKGLPRIRQFRES